MLLFLIRRVLTMVLTAHLPDLRRLLPDEPAAEPGKARQIRSLGPDERRGRGKWIENNGYGSPVLVRYGEWLGVMPGWTRTDEEGVTTGRCIARGQDPADGARAAAASCRATGASPPSSSSRSAQIIAERLARHRLADALGDDRDGARPRC